MEGPPPARESSTHILNALNDYCIQNILRQLRNFEDFLNAAETCWRFQENAKSCFPFDFRRIAIGDETELSVLPTDRVHNFLSNFGYLMKKVCWKASGCQTVDNDKFESISQLWQNIKLTLYLEF